MHPSCATLLHNVRHSLSGHEEVKQQIIMIALLGTTPAVVCISVMDLSILRTTVQYTCTYLNR